VALSNREGVAFLSPAHGRAATFREIFTVGEFRAVYLSTALSWMGDYLAKAAVTVLVYRQTNSAALTAATFAISFLPWAIGGPVLTALAERYPHRTTMVTCDLLRAVLIALVAVPHVPVPVILVLLFLTALFNPPFEGARSAMLPRILPGDGYVLATSLNNSTNQGAQVFGYLVGSAVAVSHPGAALLIDAATFAVSAGLIMFGTRWHPPAVDRVQRTHLLRETGAGFALVFRNPVLRAIALLILTSVVFVAPPEGLAAVWAARLEDDHARRGLAQAMIMIGNPTGLLIAGLLFTRLLRPDIRVRLVRPLAVIAPLCMVPALLNPRAPMVALLAGLAGVCGAGLLPAANGLFVQALPSGYRARAFGVMQTGVQLLQGASVLVTGVLAGYFPLPAVVGWWSVGGVLLLLLVVSRWWPAPSVFSDVIARTQAANAAAAAAAAPTIAPPRGGGAHAAPRGGGAHAAPPAAPPAGSAAAPPGQRSREDPSDGRVRAAESM
jgi:MFS family permease